MLYVDFSEDSIVNKIYITDAYNRGEMQALLKIVDDFDSKTDPPICIASSMGWCYDDSDDDFGCICDCKQCVFDHYNKNTK